MKIPVVVQAFFYKHPSIDGEHRFFYHDDESSFLNFPLWKPNGHAVFMWATDYVSCSDERWVVLGPFEDRDLAALLFRNWDFPGACGYRIVNEHCFDYLIRKPSPKELPRWSWSDG